MASRTRTTTRSAPAPAPATASAATATAKDAGKPASAEVGYFEAEAPAAASGRERKLVKLTNYSMSGVLPEQGSWHQERKRRVLKAHPEVQKLYGNNPWSAALLLVCFSTITYVAIRMAEVTSAPLFVAISYTLGALLSWQCATLSHEGTHRLVFKSAALNKLHACVAMLPVMLGPFGNYWAVEHMYHQIVVDKMGRYGSQQSRPLRKALGALLFFPIANLLFFAVSFVVYVRALGTLAAYAVGLSAKPFPENIRMPPYNSFPQIVNVWYMINTTLALLYNAALFYNYGPLPGLFLYLSSGFANGLHPLGMRQVQEHYLQRRGQPTYSVYSPFNTLLFNLGFHVEHHDFPQIPWNRLPTLSKMAPEFYKNDPTLFSYSSYTQILYQFLFTPGIPITTLYEDYEALLPAGFAARSS